MRKIYLILFLGLSSLISLAQTSFNTSGNSETNSNGSISYSVGQVFYTPLSTFGGLVSISPGVQQTYDIVVIDDTSNVSNKIITDVSVNIFPNPTTDFLELLIDDDNISGYHIALFDLSGKSLDEDVIIDKTTLIRMRHLPVGTYVLRLSKENTLVKTFKVIKK